MESVIRQCPGVAAIKAPFTTGTEGCVVTASLQEVIHSAFQHLAMTQHEILFISYSSFVANYMGCSSQHLENFILKIGMLHMLHNVHICSYITQQCTLSMKVIKAMTNQ